MTGWDKTDIINFLSDLSGYTSYLEICTPTTGCLYHKIDRARFKVCHRLIYRCPAAYDDGMDVNFRSPDLRTKDLFETMHALGLRYDIALVDPFHGYDASYRDIRDALGVISDRGTVVVHDCFPNSEELIGPDWTPGGWCGLTFMAFIDFLHKNPGVAYATVDTDYGCGILQKGSAPSMSGELLNNWKEARHNAKAAYRFVSENKACLLNLMSVEKFKNVELQRARRAGLPDFENAAR